MAIKRGLENSGIFEYVELDYDAFLTGLRFGYDKGNVPLLTKDERKDAFQKLQASIRNKQQ